MRKAAQVLPIESVRELCYNYGGMAERRLVEVRFTVPPEWRDALQEAARVHAISLSDLCRMIVRRFLRDRYDEKDQALLEPKS